MAKDVLNYDKMDANPSNGKVTAEASNGCIPERRKRERFRACWGVHLWKGAGHAVDALTSDVSSGGFYIRCPEPFAPGNKITAFLEIPGGGADEGSPKLVLRCDVRVLRIETLADSCDWGLGCEILDYSLHGLPISKK